MQQHTSIMYIWSKYLSVDTIFRFCFHPDFANILLLLMRKLLYQGFLLVKLSYQMESFTIVVLEQLCHKRRLICYGGGMHNHVLLSSFITYHLIFNMSKTTGATIGGSTTCPLAGAPPGFPGVHVAQSLVFSVVLSGPSLSF